MQPFNPADFLILVVDDLSKNLQVLSSILDEVGYCTTFATNGHQALDRVETAKPDLILLDMMMPDLDGLEVCKRLKSNPDNREIPVIFLTASQESEHLIKAFEIGAVDYITKPFNTPELLARVRNHLEFKHTQDQLKNTLKELIESRDQAIKSAQVKSQFLANMSHEIRTPMNAVLGMTELLLGTDLNSQQLDYLKILKNSGNNLLLIINEILDYSRLESGQMSLTVDEFNLKDTVEQIEKLFKSSVQEKSLQLFINYDSRIPHFIKGDSHRLRQILVNLISNAIKFTDTGSVKLKVILDGMLSPIDYLDQLTGHSSTTQIKLRFEVEDTGIGIKSEDQVKIFSSFFQADSSSTRKYAGTGLGLAICQQLVELMNGQIGVKSEFGKGAMFWFTVILESPTPDIREKQWKADDSMRESLAKKDQPDSLEHLKILVVEDTKINQKVILQQLKRLNCTADCVNNGQEAVDRLQLNTYDIVLMDCQMPVLDGYGATKQIRQREGQQDIMKTVIIGLTAYAMKGDREKCLHAGMDDYLSKPVSMDDLAAMLKKWSGR